jgi:hypothetical protein
VERMWRSVDLYLRPRFKQNYTLRRNLLLLCALLLISGWLTVQGWSSPAAHADGAGLASPSSAPSSASPRIQEVPDPSTGVYLGCQELAPSPELPRSSR